MLWHSEGTLVANEVKKWIAPCPLLATSLLVPVRSIFSVKDKSFRPYLLSMSYYHLRPKRYNRQLIPKINRMNDRISLYVCFTNIVIDLCWHVSLCSELCFVKFLLKEWMNERHMFQDSNRITLAAGSLSHLIQNLLICGTGGPICLSFAFYSFRAP